MKTGRKSKYEELKIVERYAALSDDFFAVLKASLKSKNKGDRQWAVEQLTKAYSKMIPQQLTGDGGGPIEVTWSSQSPTPPESGQIGFTIQPKDG